MDHRSIRQARKRARTTHPVRFFRFWSELDNVVPASSEFSLLRTAALSTVPIFRSTWTRERPHLSLAPGQVYTHEYDRPAYELFDPEHLAKEDDA